MLGLIRGLETLCDVIEYGPIKAVKINTSLCPEAERSYYEVMGGNLPVVPNNTKKIDSSADIDLADYDLYPPTKVLPAPAPKKATTVAPVKTVNKITLAEKANKVEQPVKKPAPLLVTTKVEAEVINEKIPMRDISKNISAAIHEFDVSDEEDRQLLKCFILAFMKFNNLLDKDVLDHLLDTDADKAIYIGILRWFDSTAVGHPNNAGKNTIMDSEVVLELKKFLEWELSYVKELTTDAQALSIRKGFEDILKNLQELKEDIIVSPIITVPEGTVIPKSGFTDEQKKTIIKKLQGDFADVLVDHKVDGLCTYKFNVLSEIAELIVMNVDFTGAPAKYRVDPGVIMGNGTNLIYYAMDNDGLLKDIYINVGRHPEIVKKIIDQPGYTMTLEETQQVLVDTFSNRWIYYYIDMGSFSKHLPTLKQTNSKKLEDKLAAVSNVLFTNNGIPAARFRLKEWKGVDSFTLISDKDCRSPFAMNDATCRDIVSGMLISVVKNDITVTFKDTDGKMQTAKFTIKN